MLNVITVVVSQYGFPEFNLSMKHPRHVVANVKNEQF